MAKFYGIIGYADTTETEPGYWEPTIIERECSGDLKRNYRKTESSGKINDDINISNEISIIADPYATDHIFSMKYVKFICPQLGGAWKIESAEVVYPRITISLGGVWNGEQGRSTE